MEHTVIQTNSDVNKQQDKIENEKLSNINTEKIMHASKAEKRPITENIASAQPANHSQSSAETSKSSEINDSIGKPADQSPRTSEEDNDFEPTVGMMVHDFDDETTMEEEENYENETDEEELNDLNKESEMPLEELLAMYRGTESSAPNNDAPATSSTGVSIFENNINGNREETDENGDGEKRSLRSNVLDAALSDSNSEDGEYDSPLNEDWKKKPRIGDEYQVHSIPPVDRSVYTSQVEDIQVWNPSVLNQDEVESYLKKVADIQRQDSVFKLPTGSHTPDNEDALLLLKQSNNDMSEALKRYRSRPKPILSELNIWSEEECTQFEVGLAIYGKDFHTIHLNKVKTKSVRDIVKFYYIWKKTERYDHFSAKTRLGKKKEPLHPGVTDYMERLLDENEQVSHNTNSNITDNDRDFATAPHTNALREYIRTHCNSNDLEHTYSPTLPYEHLGLLDPNNLNLEEATSVNNSLSNSHFSDKTELPNLDLNYLQSTLRPSNNTTHIIENSTTTAQNSLSTSTIAKENAAENSLP